MCLCILETCFIFEHSALVVSAFEFEPRFHATLSQLSSNCQTVRFTEPIYKDITNSSCSIQNDQTKQGTRLSHFKQHS